MKCKRNKAPDYLGITTDLTKIIARDDDLFLQFRKALGLTVKQFTVYLNCVDTAKCRTVAIAELLDNRLIGVTTFPDTFEGNRNAEALFKRCYKEHNDPDGTTGFVQPSDEEWTAMLDNGTYDDDNGYTLVITHSNP
jgi:hypothetical protein